MWGSMLQSCSFIERKYLKSLPSVIKWKLCRLICGTASGLSVQGLTPGKWISHSPPCYSWCFCYWQLSGLPTGSSQKACTHPETEKSLSHVASAGHVLSACCWSQRLKQWFPLSEGEPVMEKASPAFDCLCWFCRDMQCSTQEHYKHKKPSLSQASCVPLPS